MIVKKTPQEIQNSLYDAVCKRMENNFGFCKKTILIGEQFHGAIVYFDGMIDSLGVGEVVLRPLAERRFGEHPQISDVVQFIEQGGIYCANQGKCASEQKVLDAMLNGSVVLFLDGVSDAYSFEIRTTNTRSITEPTNENITKGAKDAFVERLVSNTALVRTRLKTPDVMMEKLTVGRQSATAIVLVYLGNTISMSIVEKARELLSSLDIDTVSSLGVIEEALCGADNSMFPQVMNTERPDKFCADINEGYLGILVDGFPFSLMVPGTLLQQMQAPEDYARHAVFASVIRVLRFVLLGLTLVLPGLYVSIIGFHQEMLPSKLVFSILNARLEVPFDEIIETVVMLIAFEVLIEAGLRMPQNAGQAVSIVGGLIVGEAAVSAKIISPAIIIVVALTAISSYTLPNQDLSNAMRVWRFILLLFSAFLGIIGLTMGVLILLVQVSGLQALGVPYLSPMFGVRRQKTMDSFIRWPFSRNRKRPENLHNRNERRRA